MSVGFPLAVLEDAMRVAIAQARLAESEGEFPYGAAVVTSAGLIVAAEHDRVAGTGDPTRHAEFDCVRAAVGAGADGVRGSALVSTVEPCAMCAMAGWSAGVGTIAFGIPMAEIATSHPDAIDETGPSTTELRGYLSRTFEVRAGVLADECAALWAVGGPA